MRTTKLVDVVLMICAITAVGLLGASYFKPALPKGTSDRAKAETDYVLALEHTRLPSIDVITTDGKRSSFSFTSSPRPKLMIAFRSTCAYCEMNAPKWAALAKERTGFDIIAVNVEDVVTAKAWLARQGIIADEIVVPADPQAVAKKWRVTSVPLTFVIDPDGVVSGVKLGVLSDDAVRSIGKQLKAASGEQHT
jgi:thiol-disulfide isomerase/thioredoxin